MRPVMITKPAWKAILHPPMFVIVAKERKLFQLLFYILKGTMSRKILAHCHASLFLCTIVEKIE